MAAVLLIPLAPSLAPGAAAAVTFAAGSTAFLAQGALQFRRGPAGLPPLTGLEGEATLQEKIADFLDGARLPVGFVPPTPQGPPPASVGTMVAAFLSGASLIGGFLRDVGQDAAQLAQQWGLANTPAREPTSTLPLKIINFSQPQDINVAGSYFVSRSETDCTTGDGFTANSGPFTTSPSPAYGIVSIQRTYSSVSVPCGVGGTASAVVAYIGSRADGSTALLSTQSSFSGIGINQSGSISITGGAQFTRISDGVPLVSDFFPDVSAFVPPQVEPETEPRRPLAPPLAPPATPTVPQVPTGPTVPQVPGQPPPGTPVPQPPGTPVPAPAVPGPGQVPEWQPGGPGTPSQPQPPAFPSPTVTPSQVPTPGPLIVPQIPGAQPTTPGGQVVTRPQPGPTTTRPGTEVIGGVTIPNRPPAPTLTGIAAEVGRIEQKLAVQLRAPGPGVGELGPLIQEILNLLEATGDQGAYLLGGPCERDSEGQPIPFEDTQATFEYGGETSALGNISSRLDALAEMIQYHKLLRQPTCLKAPPALGGEWVTVNFEQVT